MIQEPSAHHRHRFKPAVRMLRKTRNRPSVVHAKSIFSAEILANCAPLKALSWTEQLATARVVVHVVSAEQKRIERLPRGLML